MATENAKRWDAVYERVRVKYYGGRHYAPKTTDAELDTAETELGFRFPLSYRAFAKQFGLGGCLRNLAEAEIHLLSPPPDNEWPHKRMSVIEESRKLRATAHERALRDEGRAPALEYGKMVVFCGGWDLSESMFHPPEVTDARHRECRIYSGGTWGLEAVADSFPEWLAWANTQYASLWEEEVEARDQPVVYKPDPVCENVIPYSANDVSFKLIPESAAVELWLAFNNGAVRDLARSIRGGHPEALPVLADALEEAGCANADLLDSCRRGDPDIDGAWVLRVLLGE